MTKGLTAGIVRILTADDTTETISPAPEPKEAPKRKRRRRKKQRR